MNENIENLSKSIVKELVEKQGKMIHRITKNIDLKLKMDFEDSFLNKDNLDCFKAENGYKCVEIYHKISKCGRELSAKVVYEETEVNG